MFGSCESMTVPATTGSVASEITASIERSARVRSSSSARSRAIATTDAPAALIASATPRPRPRLAPTTIAFLPATSGTLLLSGLASKFV
jgi:hypothetical protein